MSSITSYTIPQPQETTAEVEHDPQAHDLSLSPPMNDSADFKGMGAHLVSPIRKEFTPDDIDLSEDEGTSTPPCPTPQPSTSRQSPKESTACQPQELSLAPTLSPVQRRPYLEPWELKEFRRGQATKRKHASSSDHSTHSSLHSSFHPTSHHPRPKKFARTLTSTTIPSMLDTPSSPSVGHPEDTTEDEVEKRNREGPSPPHPYSEYDPYMGYGKPYVGRGELSGDED